MTNDGLELAADAIGFEASGATFKMVMAVGADDDVVVANHGDTYLGIEAGIEDAGLLGVDGLEFWSQGNVKLNNATDLDGTTSLTPRMDWASATGVVTDPVNNDPLDELADLDITAAIELQVVGAASLAIGTASEYNVVAGILDSTVTFATMNVVTGNTNLGTLINADVVSVNVVGASLFVGTGHAGLDAATKDPLPRGDDAIGFDVPSVGFALASVTDTQGTGDSYAGVFATVVDAGLVGITGVELYVTGMLALNDAPDSDRIDWNSATLIGVDPLNLIPDELVIDQSVQLRAGGAGSLNIGTGAVVAGVTDFSVNIATMDVVTGNTNLGTLINADVVSVNVVGASLFVGTGHAGLDAATKDPLPRGAAAIGFDVPSVGFVLASVTDTQGTGESYTGVLATVVDAGLVGMTGVELYVTGTLVLNDAPDVDRIDWDTATDVAVNDPLNLIPDELVIDQSVKLQAGGSASLGIANGSLVATTGTFALNIATATVDDGTTTIVDADVLSIDISNAALFAGINGPDLSPSATQPTDTDGNLLVPDDAIGFFVVGASIKLALITDSSGNDYLGLEAGLNLATLTGIDGVGLELSGRVLVNEATDSTGTPLSTRVSWIDADSSPISGLLPTFTTSGGVGEPLLDSNIQFMVWGEVDATLFGEVTLAGQFTFQKATGTFAVTEPGDGETDPTTETLTDVDFLTIGAEVDTASIGGGDGVSFDNISLAMLMVSDTAPAPTKYTAIKASLGPPDLGVLPDGLTITGSVSLEINKSDNSLNPNKVLDFVDTPGYADDAGVALPVEVPIGPGSSETLSMDGNEGELLRISGSLLIDVFGFIVLEGDFGFENATKNFYLTDPDAGPTTTPLTGAEYLLINGSVTTAFAGINDDDSIDNDGDGATDEAGEINDGAIGFNLTGVEFALIVVTDDATDIQYTTLKAEVADGGFIGISGLTVGVNTLSLLVNQTSEPNSNKVLDFYNTEPGYAGDDLVQSFVVPGSSVEIDIDGNQGELISVAGSLSLDLFGFFSLSGFLAFKMANRSFKVATNSTPGVGDDFTTLTADYFVVSGTGVEAFAGAGGGTGDATGVSLSGLDFALALISDATSGITYTSLKGSGSGGFDGVPGVDIAGDFFVKINRNSLEETDIKYNDVIDFNEGGLIAGEALDTIDFEGEDGALFEVGANSIQLALSTLMAMVSSQPPSRTSKMRRC